VEVVELLQAIHAEADQESVRMEEPAPFLVEEQAVGLKRFLNPVGFAMTWKA
jgi:hypothetical protein